MLNIFYVPKTSAVDFSCGAVNIFYVPKTSGAVDFSYGDSLRSQKIKQI